MFVELLPLLAKRSLSITLCAQADSGVHLTIQPIGVKGADGKIEKVPDAYVSHGPAREIDERFASEIATYTKASLGFFSSIGEIEASTAAALKEAKEESDKKIADARKKGTSSSASKPIKKPVTPEPPKAPEPPSLFDSVPVQSVAPAQTSSAVALAAPASAEQTSDDDDDTDPEDESGGSDDEVGDSNDQSELSETPSASPAVSVASQSSIFTTSLSREDEEANILKEAFGDQDNLIAA